MARELFDTIVIGGGQAGLSVGYHLQRAGLPFLILDSSARTGDQWRTRWDSLRLFTSAAFSGLDGMPFPGRGDHFPTKDEFADYLERYAATFALPIEHDRRVDRLSRRGDSYLVEAGARRFEAKQVVVAMANYQRPSIPAFAGDLDPRITQLHSSEYRNPGQLPDGTVLVVGAGNSGAELAREIAGSHDVLISGSSPGELPFDIDSRIAHAFLSRVALKVVFHRVLTGATPIGRKARPKLLRAGPLIRVKATHLAAAGVETVAPTVGTKDGRPLLDDGSSPDVAAVVWACGYRPGFEWIDVPLRYEGKVPVQKRGVIAEAPGLYFVGLHFMHAMSSSMIHGVGRDARYVAQAIERRVAAATADAATNDAARARAVA